MLKSFLFLVYTLLALILGNEIPGNGPDKKAAVLAQIKKMLEEGKVKLPFFLIPVQDYFLGLLVDMLVNYLNNNLGKATELAKLAEIKK
jgi:hypothetical protein